jgi:hypothetical protein
MEVFRRQWRETATTHGRVFNTTRKRSGAVKSLGLPILALRQRVYQERWNLTQITLNDRVLPKNRALES